ncbi:MAG: hypothetical protein A2167_08020 [Planctomycetes bacterium RBG_13_46_10]|nr:MAG: hypothetical protein A2167_08020 [Planctomycetes bacterium RBG_13_46_10]
MKKKILSFMFFVVFFVVVLALPYSVFAGELSLIKGKGVPVCEAHYKNLKELKFLKYMVCERDKYYPEQNGITRPKWKELDLRKNKELVKKIEKFFQTGDQLAKSVDFDDEKQFDKLIERWIKSEKFPASRILYVTEIDINNDHKVEKIVLYSQALCMESHWYARPLAILDKDKNQIDVEKTMPLLQNVGLANTDLKTKAIESIYRLYDVFFYENKTYFDKWNAYDLTLSVYNQSKDKTKEVCKYKYIEKPIKK